jgi:hypothetical protein
MSKKLHWTQTPEGKSRMAEVQRKAWETKRAKMKKVAKDIVRKAKKVKPAKKEKSTSLVINGWRITLGKNEVRIDND